MSDSAERIVSMVESDFEDELHTELPEDIREDWLRKIRAILTMKNVESSNLAAAGYHDGLFLLEFLSGGLYGYEDCPPGIFEEFEKASSKGKFFHREIKDKLAYKRLCD